MNISPKKISNLITMAGPSCTGKTVFADILKGIGFTELVSTTTRPMRQGEVNGQSYNFISHEEFSEMIKNDELIEFSLVNKKYFYGLSKKSLQEFLESGKNGVLVIEPFGSENVRKYCEGKEINLHQVFLNNPLDVLVGRMLMRFKNDNLAKNETYVQRLQDMILFEQKEWVEKAYAGTHKYSQIFDSFNDNNKNIVVSSILKNSGVPLILGEPTVIKMKGLK